jgi:hypothetical protein
MDDETWHSLRLDVRDLAQMWAEDLFGFGWTVNDVFGWTARPWLPASEPHGIIRALDRRPISRLGRDSATILQRTGGSLTFYRHSPGCSHPFDRSAAMPIWRAFSPENLACAAM